MQPGDIIYVKKISDKKFSLQQLPKINGGIVVMDPFTGRILALSGGFSFKKSEFRRGKIDVYARRDDMLQAGQIFIPFCYVESAANLLTNSALDPFAKIPEFKFCAVNIKSNTRH